MYLQKVGLVITVLYIRFVGLLNGIIKETNYKTNAGPLSLGGNTFDDDS